MEDRFCRTLFLAVLPLVFLAGSPCFASNKGSKAIELQLTLDMEQKGAETFFGGTTNLPDGTKLGLWVRGKALYQAQDFEVFVKGGQFRSSGFSNNGRRLSGNYEVELVTYFTRQWQDASLLSQLDLYRGNPIKKAKSVITGAVDRKIEITKEVTIGPKDGVTRLVRGSRTVASKDQEFVKEDFLRITAETAKIFVGPKASSEVVATAKQGDIFEVRGKKGNWYEIDIASGEYRYVAAAEGTPTAYKVQLPLSEAKRRELYRSLLKTSERAETEAEARHPASTQSLERLEKSITYSRILEDRHAVDLFHSAGVQPAARMPLILEGTGKHW